MDARCANLERLRELLSATRDKVASELFDNKHVDHLTRYYNHAASPASKASGKDEQQGGEGGEVGAGRLFSHPDNLDPEALEFIEEMRRRR